MDYKIYKPFYKKIHTLQWSEDFKDKMIISHLLWRYRKIRGLGRSSP